MTENGDDSDDNQSFKSVDSQVGSPSAKAKAGAPPSPSHEAGHRKEEQRFSANEERKLLAESNELKKSANSLFGNGSFSEAIPVYDRALSSVPNYLEYELAVLHSNIAACHIKLQEWKEAIESATKAADSLERLDPVPQPKPKPSGSGGNSSGKSATPNASTALNKADDEAKVEEVSDELERAMERLSQSGHTLNEVQKLRVKVLMRRAKARSEMGGWSALQGAEEDYTFLVNAPNMSPGDRRVVQGSLAALGPRLEDAKQRDMAEMMGKLKGLGNSLLKPFGLSTDNFQFVKDEKSGGYSMNFAQSPPPQP